MEIGYIHKKEKNIEIKAGCWKYTLVGVYEVTKDNDGTLLSETKIGEYQRNYGSPGPFYAFKKNDKWYALYSKHYMYTRVMSLPDMVDLGGEEDSNVEYKNHFCPTGYYVPEVYQSDDSVPYPRDTDLINITTQHREMGIIPSLKLFLNKFGFKFKIQRWCSTKREYEGTEAEKEVLKKQRDEEFRAWLNTCDMRHQDFGFVSGCAWGDDTSDKIQFLDLREADKGIIKRDERYGYLELPRHCNLEQALDLEHVEAETRGWENMTLYIAKSFRIQVDGSYKSWWVDELFKSLKEAKKIPDEDVDKLKEVFMSFFKNGLDDGAASNEAATEGLREIVRLISKYIK